MIKQLYNRRAAKIVKLIAPIFVLCFFSITMFAQDTSGDCGTSQYWARLGVGTAVLDGHFGFGGTIGVQYSSSIGIVGIRYLNSSKSRIEPETVSETRLSDISEISATWGLGTNISLFHFSASTGVGIVWSTEKKSTGDNHFTRIGLPLEGEVTIQPLPVFGFGAVLSATLTPKHTVINPMIVIHIGKLN
ncbi:MAG: hypothetical protein IGBAC_0457 [Ignavibacteriae bacterium]|nr:MAG: hypothetical protein IGBAC_0457 [Ignavibacteriota bacterium]